jgi:hypothetical protein
MFAFARLGQAKTRQFGGKWMVFIELLENNYHEPPHCFS